MTQAQITPKIPYKINITVIHIKQDYTLIFIIDNINIVEYNYFN